MDTIIMAMYFFKPVKYSLKSLINFIISIIIKWLIKNYSLASRIYIVTNKCT